MGRIVLPLILSASLVHAGERPAPADLPARPERPDPLVMLDGARVLTRDDWTAKRKPELKSLFEHYMYGQRPAAPATIETALLHEDTRAFGGKATLRETEIRFEVNGIRNPTPIRLLLATPNGVAKAPCFVGMNFQGNHALVGDPKVRLPDAWMYDKYPGVVMNRATDAGRGKVLDVWPFELAISRGYAVATFYSGDIQPDRSAVKEGFRSVPGTEGTACIMAWAWGLSRAVDFLSSHPAIDAKRIAVVGHSRLGKVALVAGAFDERIALVIPHQAGCGGSGPSRHSEPKAEGVKRITTSFPHWFHDRFAAFGESLEKLPFDQHCLVALCAPRPVLFTNAAEDLWANPAGQFEMLKAASPVYELLGVEGLKANRMPVQGGLLESRLGYFLREGKHSMTPKDWEIYLRFADKWMK
jgi:dienelactone hydrolase